MMPMRLHRKSCEMEKVEFLCRNATAKQAMPYSGITMPRVFYQADSSVCETAASP
jgi:hypothetical protein